MLHPSGELSFVERVALVDVEVAHFLLLGLAGGEKTQRRAAEESHLDVPRRAGAMDAEDQTIASYVESRLDFDRLASDRSCTARQQESGAVLFAAG